MLAWDCFEFFGIVPRVRPRNLAKGYAAVAHDVDLTHGSLKPFLEPRLIKQVKPATHLHAWGCDLLTWDKCVGVAEWLPDCPRLFITGNADYPQVATFDKGRLTYRRLGVPPPPTAPVAHATNVSTDKSRSVAYMATYVNSFDEESGPSYPSNDVVIEEGQKVDLTFRYNPPMEYDVRKIRLYRRETGFRIGLEKEQDFDTHWFFMVELDITARTYTDTVDIALLGWAFEGLDTRQPPDKLSNITALPDTAILAGSVVNKLLFSHNLQPHNWELSQEMTLDDNVVALGALGNSLYVATDGHPYRLQADVGCDKRACRQIHRYTQSFPMINCHTGHGAIVTPFGFIYASTDGLVLLSDNPTPRVLTTEVLSQDDWRNLAPHTARLAYHKGALFVVTDKISFILWLDSTTYHDTKNKKMVTISDIPVDMVTTRQGELLLLLADGKIIQWNAGDKLRPYSWVSTPIDTGFYFDLTRVRAKVLSHTATIALESDRGSVSRNFPTGDVSIPYNRHGRRKELQLSVTGIGEVSEIVAGVCDIDMGAKT